MAADFTVSLLLQPERMARLVEFHSRSQEYPGLPEVTDALFAATWYAPVPANTYHAAVQRVAQRALLDRLIEQAGFKGNTPAVRAVLSAKIAELGAWLEEHTEESRTTRSPWKTFCAGKTGRKGSPHRRRCWSGRRGSRLGVGQVSGASMHPVTATD